MLTIFTPTYNRKDRLADLYQSLKKQKNKKFIWLIVDDGSVDHTGQLVIEWQKEAEFQIIYYYKNNGGKHTAHNYAVEKCCTEFFICVDSDDRLSEDAVNIIYEASGQVRNMENIAGVIFPSWNGERKAEFPNKVKYSSIRDLYDRFGYRGETALVFKMAVLKKFRFPVFEGEKFGLESIIYDAISREYKMMLDSRIFYQWQYQPDGYTKNINRILRENPKGLSYDLHQKIALAKGFRNKLRQYARYIMWCMWLKIENPFTHCENIFMAILALPWALLLCLKKAMAENRQINFGRM